MFRSSARKPDGGFHFISALQLCLIWWAYRHGLIRLLDLRVWFAAHELVARRCQLKRGQTPQYTCAEVHQLVGGEGRISASLRRLSGHGLLSWAPGTISFPTHIPGGQEWTGVDAMLDQVPNCSRRIPVPRRCVRFLAGGCGRVVTATLLGHLLRCLYYRNGSCRAEGFCKASWIAEVFGVSLRNVKSARQHLQRIGLLQCTDIPQWLRNRYGQKIAFNLQWAPPAPATPAQRISVESPPPSQHSAPQSAPPDSYRKLPAGSKHQEPADGRPPGILHILFQQAREAIRAGAVPRTEPEPVRSCPDASSPQQEQPVTAPKEGASLSPPTLRHIRLDDLTDTNRLLALYTQSIHAELIGSSEAERLTFVGLAQHVLAYRPENAGGLFHHLLRHRYFHVITQAEEETAQQRLKQHLYGGRGSPLLPPPHPTEWARSQRMAA